MIFKDIKDLAINDYFFDQIKVLNLSDFGRFSISGLLI